MTIVNIPKYCTLLKTYLPVVIYVFATTIFLHGCSYQEYIFYFSDVLAVKYADFSL